jgi:hypothetical protein
MYNEWNETKGELMKTRLLLVFAVVLFAFAAASPVAAQPGYCGTECSAWPPQVYCSMPCLHCPGTCIEYEWGCDCAESSTCGERHSNTCLSISLAEPDWLAQLALPVSESPAAPDRGPLVSPARTEGVAIESPHRR